MGCITNDKLQNLNNFINAHDEFAIAGHKEPDGDCIMSALVLADILKRKEKNTFLLSAGPFKRTELKPYKHLFSNEFCPSPQKKIGLFIVDCSEYSRLGDEIALQVSSYDTFIIDHHKTADLALPESIIYPTAPATAYLMQEIYEYFFEHVTYEVAQFLFFGLATDTGFFRFLDNNSSEIFSAVSRLVAAGVNPRNLYEQIQTGKPFDTRKLLSRVLEHVTPFYEGKLLLTYETLEDTRAFGKKGRDTDNLYQILLSTENVQAVVFIRQESVDNCTVGMRSKNEIDVGSIAAFFGGGGHKNAAGLSLVGTIDDTSKKILEKFKKVF